MEFPLLSIPNLDAWAPLTSCPYHVQSQFQMCDDATVFGTEMRARGSPFNTAFVTQLSIPAIFPN